VPTHFADCRFAAAEPARLRTAWPPFAGREYRSRAFADPRAELAALKVRMFCGDRLVDEG